MHMLEIILRGGVNQYYQINNLIFKTDFYTLLQLSELVLYPIVLNETNVYAVIFRFTQIIMYWTLISISGIH